MQRMMTILWVSMLLFSGSVLAQTGVFSGRVLDENKMALPGANVLVPSIKAGTATDVNGKFTLLQLPVGEHDVKITYIGFKTYEGKVTIEANKTATLTIKLESGFMMADEVMVVGEQLAGQAKALNQQKNNMNITNVVSADQVGKFPDSNIGEAMRRIPGITMQYDQGEARFGMIRGTARDLSSVTINGERVPSAEGEERSVQLDLIPADMVQTIEVSKALTPDMDADAIGGSANLITRSAPSGLRLSGTAASGYNFLSEKPMLNFGLVAGNRFMNDKLGVIVSASWYKHNLGSDNAETEWDIDDNGNPYMLDLQARKYDITRVRRSASISLDYKLGENSSIKLRSIYNWRDDWENRFRARYRFDNEEALPDESGIVKETRLEWQTKGGIDNDRIRNMRLEDQRTWANSLSGEHLIAQKITLKWSVASAKASEERPNERYITWRIKKIDAMPDISNPRFPAVSFVSPDEFNPANFTLKEITEEYQYTQETDLNARIDLKIPLNSGTNVSILKIGGRYRGKNKERDNNFFEYSPTSGFDKMTDYQTQDYSDNNYLAGDYRIGTFSTPAFLGSLNLSDASLFEKEDLPEEYLAGNYSATETITGGYAMLKQNIGEDWFFIFGVRAENTNVEYTGNQVVFDTEGDFDANASRQVEGSGNYTNVMPSFHARYDLTETSILRFAWTNTLARPRYFDLVPYRQVNLEDNELAEGNSNLKPTTSMNFDVMFENYFKSIGLVSGGVFYKKLNNFIFEYDINNYTDPVSGQAFDRYQQRRNGGDANLAGLELAFQRQLDFLPGIWRGLGVYTNYTYTYSEANGLPVEGRENEDFTLPGTAGHTFNASLSFETKKFNFRASLNYTSDYLDEVAGSSFYDRYYDTQTFVDLNATYVINPKLRFYVEAKNLTNQPLRYYQGKGMNDQMMQVEYYNARFNAGLKFDLSR